MDKVIGTELLPPCRICGQRASGIHYGVNSCEACKAFFKRSLSKGDVYECPGDRNCDISDGKRNVCAFCRFQKCIRAGMCKDAIKTGRYSYATKASNIREVRRLESQSRKEDSTIDSSTASPLDSYSCVSDLVENYNTVLPCITSDSDSKSNVPVASDSALVLQEPTVDTSESCLSPNGSTRSATGSDHSGPRQQLYDSSRVELYESIIQRMCEKHKLYAGEDVNLRENLSDWEKEYLELTELRRQIFGVVQPMSFEEYLKFYEETGIDIDGRRDIMVQCLPLMEMSIKQMIEFAKTIPGFTNLSVNDQIGLIKTTRSDIFLIGKHKCFCPERKVFSPYPGKVFHMDDIKKFKGEFVEPVFNMQTMVQKLNLTSDETATLCAICIMCTDSCEVEDSALVENSRYFLLECLFYLFDKHHPEEKQRFSRIIDILTQLRTLREDNHRFEEEIVKMWWGDITFPPLVRELWTK